MPEQSSREIGGYPTRILRAGLGPTVLWLHDTLGNYWTAGHEALARHCEVVSPAMPGFVDSTTLDGIDGPEDIVFWLLDLLEALALARPIVLGCGLGGWMAAEFAVRYAERLSGMVLVNPSGLQVEGALPADEFALTMPMLRPLAFADPTSAPAHQWLPDSHSQVRLPGFLHARVAAARLAWQFPSAPKLRGRLHRAQVPALVLWGERDGLIPASHGEAYSAGLPQARLVRLPDAAHYPYLESPERFADEVV